MHFLLELRAVHTNTLTPPNSAMNVERGIVIHPAIIILRVGLGIVPGVAPHAMEALTVSATMRTTANRMLSLARLRSLACTHVLLLKEGTNLP